jgi:hypothetical protein
MAVAQGGADRHLLLVDSLDLKLRDRPSFEFLHHKLSQGFEFGRVLHLAAQEQTGLAGSEVNLKLTGCLVVSEHVDGELDTRLFEPGKPTPIFLIRLEFAVLRPECRQEPVDHHVSANAAVIDVVLAIGDDDQLPESQRVGHMGAIEILRSRCAFSSHGGRRAVTPRSVYRFPRHHCCQPDCRR